MFPAFLLTLREVVEAALIVATIGGILRRLQAHERLRVVWAATGAAGIASVALVVISSLIGHQISTWYTGTTEALIEGTLMILAALCITVAVHMISRSFVSYKLRLHEQIDVHVRDADSRGLFILVFTSVFREGFEIVLFLTSITVSSDPAQVLMGFVLGIMAGLGLSVGIFATTVRLPVRVVFQVTSGLLILFAAGLLARGVHELAEAGYVPEMAQLTLHAIPDAKSSITGALMKSLLGLTRTMDILQLNIYALYTIWMGWWVYVRSSVAKR